MGRTSTWFSGCCIGGLDELLARHRTEKLLERDFGEGYAAIAVRGDTPIYNVPWSGQGSGPHVMPQLAGNLVFSVGVTGKLHALNAQTGELIWKRDLYEEFGATRPFFGYSSHPLPYGDKLIVVCGGKGRAIAALEQMSGRTMWAAHIAIRS